MDYAALQAVSAAGMDLERLRVELATLNLAMVNTASTPGTPGFQPLHAVGRADLPSQPLRNTFSDVMTAALRAPRISVEPVSTPPRQVYEPTHPSADARGYVAYPNIDTATEMVTLTGAVRSYEANVAALAATRALILKDLEIGQRR